jgi:hypothetical protein
MTPLKNLRRGALSRDKLVNTRPLLAEGLAFHRIVNGLRLARSWIDRKWLTPSAPPRTYCICPIFAGKPALQLRGRLLTKRSLPLQSGFSAARTIAYVTEHTGQSQYRTCHWLAAERSVQGGMVTDNLSPNASCSRQATTFPRQSRLSRRQRSAARFGVIVELSCKVEQPSGRNKFAAERLECRSAAQCATVPEMPIDGPIRPPRPEAPRIA